MIAARKGERKSPALKRIKDPILQIQEELFNKWKIENANQTNESSPRGAQIKTSNSPPQLLIDVFSMEELHGVMMRNNKQVFNFGTLNPLDGDAWFVNFNTLKNVK